MGVTFRISVNSSKICQEPGFRIHNLTFVGMGLQTPVILIHPAFFEDLEDKGIYITYMYSKYIYNYIYVYVYMICKNTYINMEIFFLEGIF